MYSIVALSFLALASTAAAQNVTVIKVGATSSDPGGIYQFSPANITASNGTVVTFQFTGAPGNHSVTQSTFANPCNGSASGFDSGWVQIPTPPADGETPPEFNITITDNTKPIWFFCKQLLPSPHCHAGMVGAINAPTTGNTFTAFQDNAKNSTGTPSQAQGGLVGNGASAAGLPSPIPTEDKSITTAPFGPDAPAASGNATNGTSGAAPAPTNGSASGASILFTSPVVALFAAVASYILA